MKGRIDISNKDLGSSFTSAPYSVILEESCFPFLTLVRLNFLDHICKYEIKVVLTLDSCDAG